VIYDHSARFSEEDKNEINEIIRFPVCFLVKPAIRFRPEPGAGKTAFSSKLIFARSDVTQLKRVYGAMSPGERNKLLRTIKANTLFRMNLKK
jgi:hypothetical protein